MYYELWDLESGNIIGSFGTEVEALGTVRDLLRANGQGYAENLALGMTDLLGEKHSIAEGLSLAARARATAA